MVRELPSTDDGSTPSPDGSATPTLTRPTAPTAPTSPPPTDSPTPDEGPTVSNCYLLLQDIHKVQFTLDNSLQTVTSIKNLLAEVDGVCDSALTLGSLIDKVGALVEVSKTAATLAALYPPITLPMSRLRTILKKLDTGLDTLRSKLPKLTSSVETLKQKIVQAQGEVVEFEDELKRLKGYVDGKYAYYQNLLTKYRGNLPVALDNCVNTLHIQYIHDPANAIEQSDVDETLAAIRVQCDELVALMNRFQPIQALLNVIHEVLLGLYNQIKPIADLLQPIADIIDAALDAIEGLLHQIASLLTLGLIDQLEAAVNDFIRKIAEPLDKLIDEFKAAAAMMVAPILEAMEQALAPFIALAKTVEDLLERFHCYAP